MTGSSYQRVIDLVAEIRSGSSAELTVGWNAVEAGGRPYLQVVDQRMNVETGCLETMKGGKWYLSPYMTDGEIVQKALQALLAFAEHEVREGFTFKGRRIYGPHIALDALMEIADRTEHRS